MTNKEIAIKLLIARRGMYRYMRSTFADSDEIVEEYDYKLEVVNELIEQFERYLSDEES